MIILAAVAGLTVLHGEAAYIAGRCAVHQPVYVRMENIVALSKLPPPMLQMYNNGVKDSESEPLTAATCKRVIAEINAELAAAKK